LLRATPDGVNENLFLAKQSVIPQKGFIVSQGVAMPRSRSTVLRQIDLRRVPSAPSRTTEVYEALRADLLSCRLRPGQRLNIAELSQTLSVSLGAVREALSRLTSDGLVVAEPQRGFTAAPISAFDLADLTRVRIDVEVQCLRRAIAVGGLGWETRLVAAHHQLSRTAPAAAGDLDRIADEWADLHADFHEALVASCDSAWLLRLRRTLFDHSERYRRLSLPLGKHPRRVDQEHAKLVEAALARKVDVAIAVITAHLQATTDALLRKAIVANVEPSTRAGRNASVMSVSSARPSRVQTKTRATK
jgi:DNA-binding GntR family transcriptional regulator